MMSEKISVSTLPVFDTANLLDSDEAISEYLSQVLNDGDRDELLSALGYIAKESGLGHESLYKALPLAHSQVLIRF